MSDLKKDETMDITDSSYMINSELEETDTVVATEVMEETQTEEEPKVKISEKLKASFQSRKFRSGAYTTSISIIVVAIVLVINIFVSKLNITLDLSTNAMFSLTEQTEAYLKTLEDDITIYYIVQPGNEYDYYTNLAEKYDSLSDHITLEYKDPVLYPKFTAQYTNEAVSENSVIIVNNETNRYKYIGYSDMQESQIDYTTYSSYTSAIDFEGQVTAAIQYVTNEEIPVFYQVTGHSETEIGSSFSQLLEKHNIDLQSVSTTKADKIPEDCEVLIMFSPRTDYTEKETTMVKDYLTNGGKALIITDYYTSDFTNFKSILEYYGVTVVDGYVMEGDYDHMAYQYAPYIIPEVNTSATILENYASKASYVVSPYSVGIKTLDTVRSSIQIESFLTTSDKAFSKSNVQSETMSKEDGDIEGPFDVGVSITETYNNVETKLVVLGCPMIGDDSTLQTGAYANYDLLSSVVNSITDSEVDTISVPSKSLEANSLTFTSSQQNFWFYTAFIVIPVFILAVGGFIVIQRRKK